MPVVVKCIRNLLQNISLFLKEASMSTPFRLSAILLASFFLLFPLHFAIAVSQTSPQSEIVLSSNDETKSDQQTTSDTSKLTWLCPSCGTYVSYQNLTCPQCGTQRLSLSSNQLELYKSVKKHPGMKKAGIALSIIGGGVAGFGLTYLLVKGGRTSGGGTNHSAAFVFLITMGIGAVLGGTGLVMLLASRGTKMEKLPQEQYPQFGYHWQEKLEALGEKPKTDGTIVPLFSMSFTF
jgi:predicted RNA-binding Zn-ribbon protein involved in translation (DUF1610 family)